MSKYLFQILHRGYFPKELPPAFNTYTFALHANNIKANVQSEWENSIASPIMCSIPKNGVGRRYVHVINPIKYFFLAKFVVENYSDIKRVCKKSCISYSKPILTDELKRRFIIPCSKNVSSFQNARIEKGMDKYVEMKVDISNFYPSIYTHTISWALVGKKYAKQMWKSREQKLPILLSQKIIELYNKGNQLDQYIEKCQNKQTHGIPVGPDTSFLIAEMILAHIDSLIEKHNPGLSGCRYYDDYYLYFDTKEEAEKTLKAMIDEFNQFGLEINTSKVEIKQMPVQTMDDFAIKLSPYKFDDSLKGRSIRIYFEMLWTLVDERPLQITTILNYGLSVLAKNLPQLNIVDERTLYMLLFKTAVLAPAVTPKVLEVVRQIGTNPDKIIVKRMADAVLRKHILMGHHIEVLWALWMCKIYSLEISAQTIIGIFSLENSLCSLMVLDYLHNVNKKLLNDKNVQCCIKRINSLMTAESLYDENWILLYEGAIKGWLKRMDLVNADSFFSFLHKQKVSFYDTDVNADYMDVNYILKKSVGIPKYIRIKAENRADEMLDSIKEETVRQVLDDRIQDDPFLSEETLKPEIDKEVDNDIEENSIKPELFTQLLYHIFSGENYDEKVISDKYVELLASIEKY